MEKAPIAFAKFQKPLVGDITSTKRLDVDECENFTDDGMNEVTKGGN